MLTKDVKLLPTNAQKELLKQTMLNYIDTLNRVLTEMIDYDQHYRFSSKLISGDLPSSLKNEVAGEALSADNKMFKTHSKQPVFKKLYASWNNQNLKISKKDDGYYISVSVWKDGKSHRISIKTTMSDEDFAFLNAHKLGSTKIKFINKKYAKS